ERIEFSDLVMRGAELAEEVHHSSAQIERGRCRLFVGWNRRQSGRARGRRDLSSQSARRILPIEDRLDPEDVVDDDVETRLENSVPLHERRVVAEERIESLHRLLGTGERHEAIAGIEFSPSAPMMS